MKLLTLVLGLCLAVQCLSCNAPTPSSPTGQDSLPAANPSLRDDMAQMLLVGFRGSSLAADNHIVRDIRDLHIGGVILFEYDAISGTHNRNIHGAKQLQQLCEALQQLSPDPLLIGIDQEGGRVCRLKPKAGFPYIPSLEQMAQGGIDTIRHYAALTSATLAQMGINLNFAPCVDVNVNPLCPIIGKLGRSIGDDPRQVARYAQAWIETADSLGIISCPKHFPGHGSSTGDSHAGLVDVSRTWQPRELEPYRALIAHGGVEMIMTTHVINRQLDPSGLPATLSPTILTQLLRDSLQFQGVIITDDMGMGAIANEYGYKEALCQAIAAGADLLCLGNNSIRYQPDLVPETLRLMQELVDEGRLSPNRIHQAAERIRTLKQKHQQRSAHPSPNE